MSDSIEPCEYELFGDERYQCEHPSKHQSRCIFHIHKTSDDDKATTPDVRHAIESEFREAFQKLLERGEKDAKIRFHDFRGFCFPAVPFKGKVFTKEVNFEQAIFTQLADFKSVVFQSEAKFGYSSFPQGVWFTRTTFEQAADFSQGWFGSEGRGFSNFYRTIFRGDATFEGVNFEQKVSFRNAIFTRDGQFSTCNFSYGADFTSATFESSADFRGAWMKQGTSFSKTTFVGSALFASTVFSDEVLFIGDNVHKVFHDECDFRNLRLNKDATLVFERLSLEKATFLDTNLEDVVFRDVYWHRVSSRVRSFGFNRMQALWDEFRPPITQELDYPKLAENYSQLVLNYERKRDYETAENFHIGEMEMRRRKIGSAARLVSWRKLRAWTNAFSVYRISSIYGTSYRQAFAVLLALILLFSLAFLYTGFKPVKENVGGANQVIEYDLLPDSTHRVVSCGQWISDYVSAISLSLSIITFQKDRFYEPLPGWSRLWLYMAVFVLTAQSAMVLLAVRRRFKR